MLQRTSIFAVGVFRRQRVQLVKWYCVKRSVPLKGKHSLLGSIVKVFRMALMFEKSVFC